MKKNRDKMRHNRAVKTKESHLKRAKAKQKREISKANSLLKFILTRNFDLFNEIIANYLNSDYTTGVWEPLFPEAHELNPDILTLRECAERVISKCQDSEGNLTSKGKALYTWLMIPVVTKRKFYNQISNKLFNEDGSAKAHDPEIWEFSAKVKEVLDFSIERTSNTSDPVPANNISHDIGTFVENIT